MALRRPGRQGPLRVLGGAVANPRHWEWVGYHEMMGVRKRYRLVDLERLCPHFRTSSLGELKENLQVSLEDWIARDRV